MFPLAWYLSLHTTRGPKGGNQRERERERKSLVEFVLLTEFHISLQLATHKNAVGVAVGATMGHSICTSLAVVGGSMLASKISQRTVATIGGLLFLGFSLSSYFYPPLWVWFCSLTWFFYGHGSSLFSLTQKLFPMTVRFFKSNSFVRS